jgi:uncharacterized protein (TIGR03435 family)
MIQVAFRVKAEQITGGPAWFDTDRWDMEGSAAKPSTADELHGMLINMLVDRLNLKFHREKKEMPMYALTVQKGGSKLTRHDPVASSDTVINADQTNLRMKLKGACAPLDYFAFLLGYWMDRPVVDLTGLQGGYDFELEFTREVPPGSPESGKANANDPDTSGPDIFGAVRKQLGLELKAQKGPVPVIVIDHADKPAAN